MKLQDVGYSTCYNADELDRLANELFPKRVFARLEGRQFWKYSIRSQGAEFDVYAYDFPGADKVLFKIFLKDEQSIEEWVDRLKSNNFIDAEELYLQSPFRSEVDVEMRADKEDFQAFKAARLPQNTFLKMDLKTADGTEIYAFAVKTGAGQDFFFKKLEDRERYITENLTSFVDWASRDDESAQRPNEVVGSEEIYPESLLDGSEVKKRDRSAIDFEQTQIGDDFYYCCDFEEGELRTKFAYGLKVNDREPLYFSLPEARDQYITTRLAAKKDLSFLIVTGNEAIEKHEVSLTPLNFFPFKIKIDNEKFYALVLIDENGNKHYLSWRTKEARRAALEQKKGLLKRGYVSAFEFCDFYFESLGKENKILEEDYNAVKKAILSPKQYKTVDIENITKEETIFALTVHGGQCRYFKKAEYREIETKELEKAGYYSVDTLREAVFGAAGIVQQNNLYSKLVSPNAYVTAELKLNNTDILVAIYLKAEGEKVLRCEVFDSEDKQSKLEDFLAAERAKGRDFIEMSLSD